MPMMRMCKASACGSGLHATIRFAPGFGIGAPTYLEVHGWPLTHLLTFFLFHDISHIFIFLMG